MNFKKLFTHFEEIAGSLLLVAVALITLFNVLSRYLFANPLSWAEEIATYLFVWMAMIGAALALKKRQHFVISFVLDRISGRAGSLLRLFVAFLIVIASGIIFANGIIYMRWGWNAVTPATEMSRAIPYGGVAFGGALILVRSVELFFDEIGDARNGRISIENQEDVS